MEPGLSEFRGRCLAYAMGRLHRLIGGAAWSIDLAASPRVRALAWAGKLGDVQAVIGSARLHAAGAGLGAAVELLDARAAELDALSRELAALRRPAATGTALPAAADLTKPDISARARDADWGKRGRGKRIMAWIAATGARATAAAVAAKFQLAVSTARKYVARARKEAARTAA